ncbi:O-antigen ligase family protein [Roseomonas elaeocarpi]|uniref:O-antigen ligase family protein n=1 Tax=Roseomonas elaeocarpi TaxID=907779 RepID=A0ABV6JXB8_9PROT
MLTGAGRVETTRRWAVPLWVVPLPRAGSPAALAGLAGAVLQMAGALKSAPQLSLLPFDVTLAAAAALLPTLPWLVASRRWTLCPSIALPLGSAGALWLWLVIAGTWSASTDILAQKLPEAVLLGPAMLLAGLLIGADDAARRWFTGTVLIIGPFVAAGIAWGLASGTAVLGGLVGASDATRVQYQLAGLAMACSAALAALRLVESRAGGCGRTAGMAEPALAGVRNQTLPRTAPPPPAPLPPAPPRPSPHRAAVALRTLFRPLFWALLVLGLAVGALLPGGRAALLSLGGAVVLAPAARFLAARRWRMAMAWVGAAALAGLLGLGILLSDPDRAQGLRTLERFTGEGIAASARPVLWAAALDWAGEAAPLGLGTGGFTVAAGYGEQRGLYPHNHALEALAEGGPIGLLLWLGCFGGSAVVLLRRLPRLDPGRAGRLVAVTLPVALGAMVSTDLGNRMVWFALGLALSAAVEVRRV